MKYEKTLRGVFSERPDRFTAYVYIDGRREICHVKNTGRCRELLLPGVPAVLCDCRSNPNRKTPFDLIAVEKEGRLINIDSQAPNAAAAELLRKLHPSATLRSEVKTGNSRIDFCLEEDGKKTFVEVKGVTLEKDGDVFFPDAPTECGVKHLRELSSLKRQGFGAEVLFIVQMENVRRFSPNRKTHPQFADELKAAHAAGVGVTVYECRVTDSEMTATVPVKVALN